MIYLTTIITAIGFLLGYKPKNGLSMPTLTCCQKEKNRKMSTKDPARGTPDGGELEESEKTESPNPTPENNRPPKEMSTKKVPESTKPIPKTYSTTVTFTRNQCLAGKPLELEDAIEKAKTKVNASLDPTQETKFRTRNLQ